MNVTSRSLNLIHELRNYKWKEEKITGKLLNEPVDKWNHALDAVRYVALNKLAERGRGGLRARYDEVD
jgi:phage terminase large subunit